MSLHRLTTTALFAALTAVGAFLRIPMGVSSITLQFLFTAMAGVLLGAKYGALSQALYVALGLVGIPVFTAGGGVGYVLQPTFGFLLGLIPAAWIIGRLSEKYASPRGIALACTLGAVTLYMVGLPYMALILNVYLDKGLDVAAIVRIGMLPFLPGDALKIFIVSALCPVLRKHLVKSHQ